MLKRLKYTFVTRAYATTFVTQQEGETDEECEERAKREATYHWSNFDVEDWEKWEVEECVEIF